MRLAVELYGVSLGELTGDARTFDFRPAPAALASFGTNSAVLSVAVPLAPMQRRDHAPRRRAWFEGLLPEGVQYDAMLAQGGLRRGDTPAFLARYGRDVAGALQIWDADDPTEPLTPALREVTPAAIRALLSDPSGAPLANDPRVGKTSLGGVQPKVVLVRTEQGWAQGLAGWPTTHILKPQLGGREASVIYDEEYGSRLARRLGLADFGTTIEDFDGLPTLVIERFDRVAGGRVHQEDFGQVLGAIGNEKYQEIGGVVSGRRIAEVLTRVAPASDLRRFARMTVLAVGLGNLDMHAKNLGLLHPRGGDVSLAPAYDVVPQAHLSRDDRMALAINGEYRHAALTTEDLVAELGSWGLRRPAAVVQESLERLAEALGEEQPLEGAFPQLHEQVAGFVANLRAGRPAGAASA